jgi:hypothetical protein
VRQPSVVMRTSLLKKVGGFRPELPHTADMEMWLRLSLYSDVGYIGGTHQGLYRIHSAGMHRSQFGTVLADLKQVAAASTIAVVATRRRWQGSKSWRLGLVTARRHLKNGTIYDGDDVSGL